MPMAREGYSLMDHVTGRRWIEAARRRLNPPPCARSGCQSFAPIWRRSTPMRVQGKWICSLGCAEAEVQENFEWMSAQTEAMPAHRVPLGLLMLSRGYLTEEQLLAVLDAQLRARDGRLGQWAQRLGFATESQVLTALSLQWACPVLRLQAPPDRDSIAMLPWEILRRLPMMPVRFSPSNRLLYVALSRRVDHSALSSVERMLGCTVVACLVSDRVMDDWLRNAAPSKSSEVHLFDGIAEEKEMARISANYVTRLDADEVRMARCGDHGWVRLISKRRRPVDIVFELDRTRRHSAIVQSTATLSPAV